MAMRCRLLRDSTFLILLVLVCFAAFGHPQERTELQSTETLLERAKRGDSRAQHSLATRYEFGIGVAEDPVKAVYWYRKAAESGNELAQVSLGQSYREGRGVTQSFAEAAKWYRLAATTGDSMAQFALGNAFYEGEGVPQNHRVAACWLNLSAEQGVPQAQWLLAVLFSFGKGVSKDVIRGHMWVNLAVSHSWDQPQREASVKLRTILESSMTEDEISAAQDLAAGWSPKSWENLRSLSNCR